MATKVRIIENGDGNYDFTEIQILTESVSNKNLMGSFNSIGSITFQRNKGESEWYGLRYVVNTTRFKELKEFMSIAKKIDADSNYKTQPLDVIEILMARRYYLFKNDFFAVTDKGKYCFIVEKNGQGYSRMVAKDRTEAAKKLYNMTSCDVNFRNYEMTLGESFLIE